MRVRSQRFGSIFAAAAILVSSHGEAAAPAARPLTVAQHFAREDALAKQLQQRNQAIVAELEKEFPVLRARMKSELVGKDFALEQKTPNGIHFALDSANCVEVVQAAKPCVNCERLTEDGFDKWFAANVADFNIAKAILEADPGIWAADRARYRAQLKEADLAKTMPASWLERENDYYTENYLIVAWMANLVWSLHAAELTGLNVRHLGVLHGDFDASGFHRGPADFPGMFHRLNLQSELAVFPTQRVAMEHGCQAQIGFDGILVGSDESRAAAEAKYHNESIEVDKAFAACAQVEEAQRDLYAPQFRDLRDRLVASRTRLRDKLEAWRKDLIAAHVYAGEGDAAITAVYGDGHHIRLDGTSITQFMLRYSNAQHPAIVMASQDAGEDVSGAAVQIENECRSRAEQKIKYPDIEKEAFFFALNLNQARKVQRSTLAAAAGDRP